ncbi:MAG TPA: nicotinamide-nucleotide amidohydrolase family protein [Ornithinicoccus sp.]|nr:nicotinamide-nucleotide amidohydrolase family protein [Ornithinicoccus sp.]
MRAPLGMDGEHAALNSRAGRCVAALTGSGLTIATAESLTGGLLAGALTSVPGASEVVRGGVVSYALDIKADVLGVPRQLLEDQGAVSADTALAMADGARRVTAADFGVATTGVAGPDPSEGKPVGTVFVAVTAGPGLRARESGRAVRALTLRGSREEIRQQTVESALDLVLEVVSGSELAR